MCGLPGVNVSKPFYCSAAPAAAVRWCPPSVFRLDTDFAPSIGDNLDRSDGLLTETKTRKPVDHLKHSASHKIK